MPAPPVVSRRRADAERNVRAILDAAAAVLAERPDASMSDVAAAAGLARQTVYAHFASRDALLTAVAERALDEAVAAIDAARPGDGPPAEALDRLVAAWWASVAGHARVLEALAAAYPGAEAVARFHAPIVDRLERLLRRGRRAGTFERADPVRWQAAAFLALMHAAADEVAADRMDRAEAAAALRRAVSRLVAAG
jgi:AcrR family transcriptional regulator